MSSVREQVLQAVMVKLEAVRVALDWATLLRNPREELGSDQLNALVLEDGGLADPRGLTGHVSEEEVDFSVTLAVVEQPGGETAEEMLDQGFVAVKDALLDPTDIQLGGIAIGVFARGGSEPMFGRATQGAQVVGGMSMNFSVQFLEREGDASTPGP